MKCPECKNKFPMQGNSKEEIDKNIITCPKCATSFELQALKKLFPKGMLIMFMASMIFGFLSAEIAILLFLLTMVPVVKWLFKPENIVKGNN